MQRCLDNGISRLFLPNVDSASIELVMSQVKAYPQYCFAMLGLHPCDVKETWQDELNTINTAIPQHKIYAIGEIGIDLYWDKTTLDNQVEAFKIQINWAKKLKLPIVIHCRDAFEEVYKVLLEERDEDLRGIFHCFSGNMEEAQKIADLGFLLGIGGVVTYKSNKALHEVVRNMPLESLVLETDAPYLSPVPFRGKRNESSYLTFIAEKIAEIRGISIEEVGQATTENAAKLFAR